MKNITYEELHRQLMYNPWNGLFYWKVRPANCVQINDIAGHKDIYGYITIRINNKLYKSHRLAWLYVYGYFPENDIDHIDNLPEHRHHNWISNLREASDQCNQRNQGTPKNNTSGVKGIYWNKLKNKWQATLKLNRKSKFLGTYKDFDNAVCARLAGEQCVGWEGCDSCSPAFKYVKENIQ